MLLLWQLSWFHMAESGFTSVKISDQPGWKNVSVPADGIYIVSLTVDSSYGPPAPIPVSLRRRDFKLDYFITYAMSIVGHAEAAVALKKNDTLTVFVDGWAHVVTSFSVAYVSGLDGHYTTVVTTSDSNSTILHFNKQLTANSWSGLSGNQSSSFSVPTTGMYWVTARVMPISSYVIMSVGPERHVNP